MHLNAICDNKCAAPALEPFSYLLPASTKMPMEETCPPLSDDAIFTPLDNCSTVAAADGPNVPGESSGKPGPTSVIVLY